MNYDFNCIAVLTITLTHNLMTKRGLSTTVVDFIHSVAKYSATILPHYKHAVRFINLLCP